MAVIARLTLGLILALIVRIIAQTNDNCRADVCFVLDESGSITLPNWRIIIDFVQKFVSNLDIGLTGTMVGVVKFSTKARLAIGLDQYQSKDALVRAIGRLDYYDGGTDIAAGINNANGNCFNKLKGDRPDEYAPNILILMTDGGANNRSTAKVAADAARARGIKIIAIGVTDVIDLPALEEIVDAPDLVFNFTTFADLADNVLTVFGRSCKTIKDCDYNQTFALSDDYPNIEKCPFLHDPELRDEVYIEFKCEIFYKDSLSTAADRYRIRFLFDDVYYAEVPEYIISPTQTYAILEEKYLSGRLDRYVSCQVESYFVSKTSVLSPAIKSRKYFAGIVPSNRFVRLYEGGDALTVYFFSTLPIACSVQGARPCTLTLEVNSTSDRVVMYQPHIGDFKSINICKFVLYDKDWRSNESLAYDPKSPLQLLANVDDFVSSPQFAKMIVTTVNSPKADMTKSAFDDYTLAPILVEVHDGNQGTCRSRADPNITPFDASAFYSAQQVGYFVMVRSKTREFEIHVQHFPCYPGINTCSVVCGVVVRENNYIMAIQRCNELGIVYQLQLHPGKGPGLINNPGKSPVVVGTGMVMKSNIAKTEYMIVTAGGAKVRMTLRQSPLIPPRGLDLAITLSPRDRGSVQGLCGNFDGNPANDFVPKDGVNPVNPLDLTQLNTFIESYRLTLAESWFMKSLPSVMIATPFERFCHCLDDANRTSAPIDGVECGLDALQSPLKDLDPNEFVRPFIPRFILKNIKRRTKRQTQDADANSDAVIDFTMPEYPDSQVNSVPLPFPVGGINETTARAACTNAVNKPNLISMCPGVVGSAAYNDIINTCLLDIQRTGSLNWAEGRSVELVQVCVKILTSQNVMDRASPAFTKLVNSLSNIANLVCPRDCSGHGACVNGSCVCNSTWLGPDCSVSASQPPVINDFLNTDDICDISMTPCRTVILSVTGVTSTAKLSCIFTVSNSSGDIMVYLPGQLASPQTLVCPLPAPGTDGYYNYTVMVSNDRQLNSQPLEGQSRWVLDSDCIICNGNTCSRKSGTCIIGGECFADGEEVDKCTICNSTTNATAGTAKPNNACEYYGIWSNWSPYSNCSKPCDNGIRTRTRTCQTQTCSGADSETQLCNEGNCPRSETGDTGITYHLVSVPMKTLVQRSTLIRALLVRQLNNFCVGNARLCCASVQLQVLVTPSGMHTMFQIDNVKEASGYPKYDKNDILMKILVEVYITDWGNVCQLSTSRRRKRALTEQRVVSQSLLNAALGGSTNAIVNILGGGEVNVAPPTVTTPSTPQLESGAIQLIAYGVIGGVVFLIIIILGGRKLRSHLMLKKEKSLSMKQQQSVGDSYPSVQPYALYGGYNRGFSTPNYSNMYAYPSGALMDRNVFWRSGSPSASFNPNGVNVALWTGGPYRYNVSL